MERRRRQQRPSRGLAVASVLLAAVLLLALIACSHAADKKADAKGKKTKTFKSVAFVYKEQKYTSHQDPNTGRVFYAAASGETRWDDPRREMDQALRGTVLVVVIAPFVLLAVGGAGYILYMKKYYPDKLAGPKKKKGAKKGAAAAAAAATAVKPKAAAAPVAAAAPSTAKKER